MRVKAFLDTNIIIYLYSEDDELKRNAARNTLDNNDCVTSIQVMNESSNVWFSKSKWSEEIIKEHLDNIEAVCDDVLPIYRETINTAISLKSRYNFSYFDSLMLASAIESGCKIIFTEDMNDGQLIDGTLKIVNPFNKA